jgi:hypothetical protein
MNPSPRFYKSHLFLIQINYALLILTGILLRSLGVLEAPYFSVGPSEHLKFFNLVIDTYELYIGFVLWRVITVVLQTMCSSVVGPWISTVFQNRTIPEDMIGCSLPRAIFTLNSYEIQMILQGLISVFMYFSQIDLALIEGVTYLFILNAWTIPRWLEEKKKYAALEAEKGANSSSIGDIFAKIEDFKSTLLKQMTTEYGILPENVIKSLDDRLDKIGQEVLRDLASATSADHVNWTGYRRASKIIVPNDDLF